MKISKKAPLRAYLYATGLYVMVVSVLELKSEPISGWAAPLAVLMVGSIVVLGTFAQACSELHRREVPGKGVLHPRLTNMNTQPVFIESRLGEVSMTSFVRRRP